MIEVRTGRDEVIALMLGAVALVALSPGARAGSGEARLRWDGEQPVLRLVLTATADGGPASVDVPVDVYDPEGHFIKQVSVACEGDGREDALLFAGENHFILVKGLMGGIEAMQGGGGEDAGEEEPAPMEVVYYKVAG